MAQHKMVARKSKDLGVYKKTSPGDKYKRVKHKRKRTSEQKLMFTKLVKLMN